MTKEFQSMNDQSGGREVVSAKTPVETAMLKPANSGFEFRHSLVIGHWSLVISSYI
jgi:hypothetical protein